MLVGGVGGDKQMRGLHDRGVRMREVRGERVNDARRICRGMKSFFVLDALETADMATIRPSFRGKERQSLCVWEREGEREQDLVLLAYWTGSSKDMITFMCDINYSVLLTELVCTSAIPSFSCSLEPFCVPYHRTCLASTVFFQKRQTGQKKQINTREEKSQFVRSVRSWGDWCTDTHSLGLCGELSYSYRPNLIWLLEEAWLDLFWFNSNFLRCSTQSWREKWQKVGMNDKSQSWYHFSIIAMRKTCDVNNRWLFQGGCRCMCVSSLPQPSVSEGGRNGQKAVCQLPN